MGKEPIDYAPIDKALKQQALDKLAKLVYTSNAQIARDQAVSVSSVEKRKKLLAKANVMQEAEDICRNDQRGTKKRPKGTRGNASPFLDSLQRAASSEDAEAFFQAYAEHKILTPEESMRLMSGLACDPRIPPQARTQADKQLDALRTKHAPRESLGPGPPLTLKDKLSRLKAILEACPDSVLEQAFATMTFPTPEECDTRVRVIETYPNGRTWIANPTSDAESATAHGSFTPTHLNPYASRESTGIGHTEYWGQTGPEGFTKSVSAHGRLADQYRCLNCDEPKIADHDTRTFRHRTPEAAERCANTQHPDWAKRIDRLKRVRRDHEKGGSPSSPKPKEES